MNLLKLTTGAFAASIFATGAFAATVTYDFTATRTDLIADFTPPDGTASAFFGTAAGATVSGRISYDAAAPLDSMSSLPNGAESFFYAGSRALTVNIPGADDVTLVDDTPGFGMRITDGDVNAGFTDDVFSLNLVNSSELIFVNFVDADGVAFDGGALPTELNLADLESVTFGVLFLDRPSSDVFFNAFYEIDSLTLVPAVPLPASSLMLLGGVAGFGVIARRRKSKCEI